jgi:ATP-dependent Clp protease protease subunit
MQEKNSNIYYKITVNDREEYCNLSTMEAEQGIFRIESDDVINAGLRMQFSGFVNHRVSKHQGEPIYIIINSPGGHVTDGLAIYDTMSSAKAMGSDVYTIATGRAASMGAFLLAAGTKGCRFCTPNAEVLLHQPLGGVRGQATDMVIVVDNIVKTKERLTGHLAGFTGQSVEELTPKLERDYIMSPEQALREGVIDGIEYEVNIIRERG